MVKTLAVGWLNRQKGAGMKHKLLIGVSIAIMLSNVRPAAGVVTEVRPGCAVVATVAGENIVVEGEDWARGDVTALLMDKCGTECIDDDQILLAHYVGTVADFVDILGRLIMKWWEPYYIKDINLTVVLVCYYDRRIKQVVRDVSGCYNGRPEAKWTECFVEVE